MESNIYICKKYPPSGYGFYAFQEFTIGDKYLLNKSNILNFYKISIHKSGYLIDYLVHKEDISKYFDSLEEIREDKLNMLFDEI